MNDHEWASFVDSVVVALRALPSTGDLTTARLRAMLEPHRRCIALLATVRPQKQTMIDVAVVHGASHPPAVTGANIDRVLDANDLTMFKLAASIRYAEGLETKVATLEAGLAAIERDLPSARAFFSSPTMPDPEPEPLGRAESKLRASVGGDGSIGASLDGAEALALFVQLERLRAEVRDLAERSVKARRADPLGEALNSDGGSYRP